MKKIVLDENKCLKCGLCTNICPEIFSFDKNGNVAYKALSSKLIKDKKTADNLKLVEKLCSGKAIKIL